MSCVGVGADGGGGRAGTGGVGGDGVAFQQWCRGDADGSAGEGFGVGLGPVWVRVGYWSECSTDTILHGIVRRMISTAVSKWYGVDLSFTSVRYRIRYP